MLCPFCGEPTYGAERYQTVAEIAVYCADIWSGVEREDDVELGEAGA